MTVGNLNNRDVRDLSDKIKAASGKPVNEDKGAVQPEKIKPVADTTHVPNIQSADLNPTGIEFKPKSEPIGTTKTGAKIIAHTDPREGNARKTTDYLCGHVFRIGTEMKTEGLKYTGFIHVAKEPKENQFFDVLGTGIKGFSDKLSPKNPVTVIVTGFTQFNGVPDNPTGRFLFGDGTSTDSASYGLKKPQIEKIDKMMEDKFKPFSKPPEPVYNTDKNGVKTEIGRSYTYKDSKTKEEKTINLTFVRLPVDDDLTNTANRKQTINGNTEIINLPGDTTGDILRSAVSTVKPDALISFGAGTQETDNYNVETISYGMVAKGAVYSNKDSYISNNDLFNIYTEQLKK